MIKQLILDTSIDFRDIYMSFLHENKNSVEKMSYIVAVKIIQK